MFRIIMMCDNQDKQAIATCIYNKSGNPNQSMLTSGQTDIVRSHRHNNDYFDVTIQVQCHCNEMTPSIICINIPIGVM
jgi:hypothetical protein